MSKTLRERVMDEADLCRNEGADDIARLLDEVAAALADQAQALGTARAMVASLTAERAARADQAQAEPDRRLQLAMQNAERWKAHALELSARLQQYEPGAGMALNAATQPAAQPVAAPDERKAFESWARIRGFRAERTMPADAAYNDSGSQIMWESWQARAMLAAAPKVQP